MKKILSALGAMAAVLVITPMFAAFEAHVVNVTATIENALSVNREEIQFGTVFPQEHLNEPLEVRLSDSFMAEGRVDDVDYFIRQKPKCGITSDEGRTLDHASTATGHVKVGDNPDTNEVEAWWIDCGEAPRVLAQGEEWGVLPDLCPYISKHGDRAPENDGWLDSFHKPWEVINDTIVWNDTKGHLAKSAQDIVDNWVIDLAVPCFTGQCAQDWEDFVNTINPNTALPGHMDGTPADYVADPADEHKVYGCDLWIEVAGISLPGLGCKDKFDLMLVVDRSGSIQSTNMGLVKTASKNFIDALAAASADVHFGMSSFATTGTLDQHLTDDAAAIKAKIDLLVSTGTTNLEAGITLANGELENPGDGHDRADGDSPDFMVIVTDGIPNVPDGPTGKANALAAATAAKNAGTTVYVVGVGAGVDQAFLESIATSPAHYFSAADFDALEAELAKLASCND